MRMRSGHFPPRPERCTHTAQPAPRARAAPPAPASPGLVPRLTELVLGRRLLAPRTLLLRDPRQASPGPGRRAPQVLPQPLAGRSLAEQQPPCRFPAPRGAPNRLRVRPRGPQAPVAAHPRGRPPGPLSAAGASNGGSPRVSSPGRAELPSGVA